MARLAFVDAETRAIRSRPDYPPESVGYALKYGRRCEYLAFGHPEGNNCTRSEAIARVKSVLRDHVPVFHGADFDLEVMERDGIRYRGEFHDTLRLAFLNDPYARDLGLKPQAEEYCGVAPEERDLLREWVVTHVPEARRRKTKWGEYIDRAPGGLVGEYAKGDVRRTQLLMEEFGPSIVSRGMWEAYQREIQLIPIKLDMEYCGIRVRLAKLKRDLKHYEHLHDELSGELRRVLGRPDMNLGSSKQLASALVEQDLLDPVVRTAKGNVSTKRDILESNCADPHLSKMLAVYGVLDTYLSTFLRKWIEIAESNDGYVQPTFNTTRGANEFGGQSYGTRTGRFSSSNPNFQNIPNSVEESQNAETLMLLRKWMKAETGFTFVGLRDYFEPDEGDVFVARDYDQQELRILADSAGGEFLSMYLHDPDADGHELVRQMVHEKLGVLYPRKHIKITNFGIIYGMGAGKLAKRLDISYDEARTLKRAILKAVPGIVEVSKRLRKLADRGEPFYTWGGREYYCEEPRIVETEDGGKERRTYEYKMLNTLIQGGAADCTKQGMINTWENLRHGRIVLQVHDELLCSVPKSKVREEDDGIREGMEDVEFKLKMLSEGKVGGASWARMKKLGR